MFLYFDVNARKTNDEEKKKYLDFLALAMYE